MLSQLNIIDSVTNIINSLNNISLREKINHEIPIVIAVGDQSSGKSSIMSKILGHDLPTKNGICTRIPVKISTRREILNTEIILVDKKSKSVNYYKNTIMSGIMECQEEAMKGKNTKFSSDHTIDILVGSHQYDLTIIDLPGLIAYNSENKEDPDNQIYEIVKSYINTYSKAIIFHIVEAIAESEKVQSLKFVRNICKKTNTIIINIITKSDLYINENTFKELVSSFDGKTFIMNGNDSEEKPINNIICGKNAVCEYLENKIKININLTFNQLKKFITNEKIILEKRVLCGDLREYNSYLELIRLLDFYKTKCEQKFINYRKEFKTITSILKDKIKDLRAYEKYEYIPLKTYKNLEDGDEIFLNKYELDSKNNFVNYNNKELVSIKIIFVNKNENYFTFMKDGKIENSNDYKLEYYQCREKDMKPTSNYYFTFKSESNSPIISLKYIIKYGEEASKCKCDKKCKKINAYLDYIPYYIKVGDETVITEIKNILKNTGELEHDLHKSVLSVIQVYSSRFAENYTKAIYENQTLIKNAICELFVHIENIEIKDKINIILQNIDKEFNKRIKSLYKKNTRIEMINSTNDHYLTATFAESIKENEDYCSDESVYHIAKFQVEAYIKDQTKYIQQASYDIMNEFYFLGIKRLLQLLKISDEYDDEIYEPLAEFSNIDIEENPRHEKNRIDGLSDLEYLKKCIDILN